MVTTAQSRISPPREESCAEYVFTRMNMPEYVCIMLKVQNMVVADMCVEVRLVLAGVVACHAYLITPRIQPRQNLGNAHLGKLAVPRPFAGYVPDKDHKLSCQFCRPPLGHPWLP